MKLAPVYRALCGRDGVEQIVVHTGQHYDENMSENFFRDLGIPSPHIELAVGSASHAVQTAKIMMRIERVLLERAPDWTVVYGDVNSTVAAALVAVKLGCRLAHVEAGLRSRDPTMPEEINRIVTDRLSSLLFTPSRDAGTNLRAEGLPEERIVFVGNVMIDTLLQSVERARKVRIADIVGEDPGEFVLVTLHRPSNVDDERRLTQIMEELNRLARSCPVVFPVHPRTRERLDRLRLSNGSRVRTIDPVGYVDMVALMLSARSILTDSGGVQEESSVLGVRCVTLRQSTERPITIERGTNVLEPDPSRAIEALLTDTPVSPIRVEGWDGKAAERIADALILSSSGTSSLGS